MGKYWAESFDFIGEKFCGDVGDWMDAVEALGVRAVYYNGCQSAYLGRTQPCWTNARVAKFETREAAEEWCNRVNEIFEID